MEWATITPNQAGDWINQRNDSFARYPIIGDKKNTQKSVFATYSRGLETTRDAWVYNFSLDRLESSVAHTVSFFNSEAQRYEQDGHGMRPEDFVSTDSTKISWSSSLTPKVARGMRLTEDQSGYRQSIYRPFTCQHAYFNSDLNHRRGELASMFPTPHHANIGFYLNGIHSTSVFAILMMDELPCLDLYGKAGQFFPRWTYCKVEPPDGQYQLDTDSDVDEWGYRRIDNVTAAILSDYRAAFGERVTKDDIFYYTYGLLHSPQYREAFAADLRRMLPRIPRANTTQGFNAFCDAGRRLAELHVSYETVEPYPLREISTGRLRQENRELWRVNKIKWHSKSDHSAIVYNNYLTLEGIPDEAHRYVLSSRSALEWLIDRYRVTTDPASGIVNDPNDWCDEYNNPRYIVDLIKRITTVSVETVNIVDALPELNLGSSTR